MLTYDKELLNRGAGQFISVVSVKIQKKKTETKKFAA